MKIVKGEMIKVRLELNAIQSDSEISYLDGSTERVSEQLIEYKFPKP